MPRLLQHLGVAAAVVVALALVVVAVAPLVGHRVVVLRGPSMTPTHEVGDALLVRRGPAVPSSGDVVTYHDAAGRLTTHRVVGRSAEQGQQVLWTQGDANAAPDPEPVPVDRVLGTVVADLGSWGTVLVGSRASAVRAVPGVAALLLVAREVAALTRRARARRRAADADGRDRPRGRSRSGWLSSRGTPVAAVAVLLLGSVCLPAVALGTASTDVAVVAATTSAAPSRPTGLVGGTWCLLLGGVAELAWAPDPLAGSQDIRYEVLRDGVVHATVTGPVFSERLGLGVRHSYAVRAVLGPWTSPTSSAVTVVSPVICL